MKQLKEGIKLTSDEFLRLVIPVALEAEKEFNIPAEVTVGQAIVESGWGESKLSQRAFNLFGIKAGSDWHEKKLTMVGHEFIHGRVVSVPIEWRVYNTFEDSIRDHTKFLLKPRYKNAFQFSNNPEKFLEEIWKAGYATDPNYVHTILNTVNSPTVKELITRERQK